MKDLWYSLTRHARIGLVLGVVVAVAITIAVARWSFAKNYGVLFAGLSEQDAAAMVAELDRTKQPYELAADGTKILVPKEAVHKTRLHLVGKNLPTHGGVGFEIFNHSDYGMTEFTQKVNYQRALQGELTRTILALDEVHTARVHLVLPEGGLFKRAEQHAKASVTLSLKTGRTLEKEQILGIQRLVAASVPDIEPKHVTVLGSSGVALSASPSIQTADSGDWKLETKRQIEEYLTRKLSTLVSRAVGADRAAVSVDVLLDYDNVKTTSEEVIAASGDAADRPAGVLIRERQTVRNTGAAKPGAGDAPAAAKESDVTSVDSEYQTGRRVQQIISTPGSVKRITVGVVLPPSVDLAQVEKLRDLVSVAAGLDKSRGDGVAIHSLAASHPEAPAALDPGAATGSAPSAHGMSTQISAPPSAGLNTVLAIAALLATVAFVALAVQALQARRRARSQPTPALLDDAQRQQLLVDLRGWLAEPGATASTPRS